MVRIPFNGLLLSHHQIHFLHTTQPARLYFSALASEILFLQYHNNEARVSSYNANILGCMGLFLCTFIVIILHTTPSVNYSAVDLVWILRRISPRVLAFLIIIITIIHNELTLSTDDVDTYYNRYT